MSSPLPTASPIMIVTATRSGQDDFLRKSPLFTSLEPLRSVDVGMIAAFDNQEGLPAVYNRMMEQRSVADDTIFVFCHDDIHILDYFWTSRLCAALERFDIVGLAGNRRRAPGQGSWCFIDDACTWDEPENLSGAIGHGTRFPCRVDQYGPVPQECRMLDGMFIAVRRKTLLERELRFDERFAFHLYDVDFCRQAETRGLTMGTAPIGVMHESEGSFGCEAWKAGYRAYLDKWGG